MNAIPLRHSVWARIVLAAVIAASVGATLLLILQTAEGAAPAEAAVQPNACASVLPQAECDALAELYASTDGANWDDNAGWMSAGVSPCEWYGVDCAGGRVSELRLSGNRLTGRIPASIASLTSLRVLELEDNLLRGDAPPRLCELKPTLQTGRFDHNALYASNLRAKRCLDDWQPDWAATQTVAPAGVEVTGITSTTVELSWTPIAYQPAGGFYEISYAPIISGTQPVTAPLAAIVHGTVPLDATGYTLDGLAPGETYVVWVGTATLAGPEQENDLFSEPTKEYAATVSPSGKALVIVYFAADNDLSPYVEGVVRRMRLGTARNPNVAVTMLVDERGPNNSQIVKIENGQITPTAMVQELWQTDEVDTSDPEVLGTFLRAARDDTPAAVTVVSLMGHGMGLMPEFEWIVGETPGGEPITQEKIPALPKSIEATPGDFNDNTGYMSTVDFGRALAAATDGGAEPFDLVFFDQCFQGNLDVLYEVRQAAEVFVASPNYAWLSAPYHQYLTAFAPARSPEEMASLITSLYEMSLNRAHPNSIFWLRGADIEPIAAAASALGAALRQAAANGAGDAILAAARESVYVDTTQCGEGKLELGPPDELLGAESFARALRQQQRFRPNDPDGVRTAADGLLTEMEKVHKLFQVGIPYLDPDVEEMWTYQDSLTLVAPLARDTEAGVAWRASVYTASQPLTAVWSPLPSQTVEISTTLAFAREAMWDDFIAAWYDGPLTPTVGEWCQYSPPSLVSGDVTEDLALSLTPEDNALRLGWSATAAANASDYWIRGKGSDSVSWVLVAAVEVAAAQAEVLSYSVPAPPPGESWTYLVTAQDEYGITLAQSNEAGYTSPPEPSSLYLPLLNHTE